MKEEPDHADSILSETMAARLEIEQLGDAVRQKEIIDAVVALDGVIEATAEKGALHVSFDPLATTQKKIEQAVRGTGNTVTTASADTETPHPKPANAVDAGQAPVENAHDAEGS
jgi:copper chaperone CopZ